MLTFSTNSRIDSPKKIQKVAELVKQMNEYNEEFVADALFNIADGYVGAIDLTDFARANKEHQAKNEDKLSKSIMKVAFLSEEESKAGYAGVVDLEDPMDYEGIVIDDADTDYYVETFLSLRQFLFFTEGVDIWRQLTLIRRGDKCVAEKFRQIADTYCMTQFFVEFCKNLGYIYAVQRILH